MVEALLYDQLEYLVGEPIIQGVPFPKVLVWGNDTYVFTDLGEGGRPRYHWATHYVIPETRETPCF